jgi:hypothetical protein
MRVYGDDLMIDRPCNFAFSGHALYLYRLFKAGT